jgi:superfamily I DNA/RNA helicase
MVIGPSLTSETNKTSKYAQKISHIFRTMGVPCKIQSEGSYSRNGVLFSTIQSIKGKEADYVFIFGMDNYPNTFNMIQYEIAESLIYIAHSRARKKIFYMISSEHNIKLPRGVLESNTQVISGIITTAENEKLPKDTFKNVTDLCKDFGFLSYTSFQNS